MKKISVILASALLVSLACLLRAQNNGGHMIELIEVENPSQGFSGGDLPLDEPGTGGEDPTNPVNFQAMVNGHVLSIAAPNSNILTRLNVYNSNGQNIIDQSFRRRVIVHISNTGDYTLTLRYGMHTLHGYFSIME